MKEYTAKDLSEAFDSNIIRLSGVAECSAVTLSNIFKENNKIKQETKEDIIYYLKKESERLYKEDVARICEKHRERIKIINYMLKER